MWEDDVKDDGPAGRRASKRHASSKEVRTRSASQNPNHLYLVLGVSLCPSLDVCSSFSPGDPATVLLTLRLCERLKREKVCSFSLRARVRFRLSIAHGSISLFSLSAFFLRKREKLCEWVSEKERLCG